MSAKLIAVCVVSFLRTQNAVAISFNSDARGRSSVFDNEAERQRTDNTLWSGAMTDRRWETEPDNVR